MADIHEGYTKSERCLICARPARRGATLCAQCKAALRRARHAPSVKTEYLPRSPVVRTDTRRFERNSSYSRAARRATPVVPPPPAALGGWGTYATIISFGLAVCLTGYLAIGENERAYSVGRTAPPVAPSTAPAAPQEGLAAKVATPLPAVAADPRSSSAPWYEVGDDEHVAIFESLPVTRASADRKRARAARAAKNSSVAQGATEARKAGVGTRRPVVAPAMVANAHEGSSEPAAPDRWEQLASAQSSCDRENVIAGLVCKERVRLQFCEGEWGVAPQCPMAMLNTR